MQMITLYELLKDGLSKLGLNDASFTFKTETSAAAWTRIPMWILGPTITF